MEKINILIVDDEALLRQGLRALLEKEPFVNRISEAESESQVIHELEQHAIDLILLDVRLRQSNGIELMAKHGLPDTRRKVIAVTGLDGEDVIIHLLKAGVQGIVYKLDGYQEIVKAIKTVMRTGSYLPESIVKVIQANAHRWKEAGPVTLSIHEMELLRAIASGSTTKEIAAKLKITDATADTYRVRLLKKLGVANTASLLAYAFRNGIL